jgi:hypothetical protein
MPTFVTRRTLLASAAIAPMVGSASAADFHWKRFNGSQLRFMVSVHPWTEWAQKQLPALEAETGIKVNLEILYEDLCLPFKPSGHIRDGVRRGVGLLRVTQSPARDDQEGRPFRAKDGYGCDCNSRHRL